MTRCYTLLLAALVALTALPGRAEPERLQPQAGDIDIKPATWREMVMGKTVYYSALGEHWGREYYWPGTNRVTFQHASGDCAEATWEHDPVTLEYCFYFDRPNCFRHMRRGEEIVILPTNPEPTTLNVEQMVTNITVAPFSCAPDIVS